jgi:hypothetical protein
VFCAFLFCLARGLSSSRTVCHFVFVFATQGIIVAAVHSSVIDGVAIIVPLVINSNGPTNTQNQKSVDVSTAAELTDSLVTH